MPTNEEAGCLFEEQQEVTGNLSMSYQRYKLVPPNSQYAEHYDSGDDSGEEDDDDDDDGAAKR